MRAVMQSLTFSQVSLLPQRLPQMHPLENTACRHANTHIFSSSPKIPQITGFHNPIPLTTRFLFVKEEFIFFNGADTEFFRAWFDAYIKLRLDSPGRVPHFVDFFGILLTCAYNGATAASCYGAVATIQTAFPSLTGEIIAQPILKSGWV